jgi:hypothetical protein
MDGFPFEFALEVPLERPLLPANNLSRLWGYSDDSEHTINSL